MSRRTRSVKKQKVETDPFDMCETSLHEFDDEMHSDVPFDRSDIGRGKSIFAPTAIKLEQLTLDDVQQALLTRMDRMEQNMTYMMKRVFTEVIALRQENALLKTKIREGSSNNITKIKHGKKKQKVPVVVLPDNQVDLLSDEEMEEPVKCDIVFEEHSIDTPTPKITMSVIPKDPIDDADEFWQFERAINEDVNKEQSLIDQLSQIASTTPQQFVRICWRTLITDSVANKFCWSGTTQKKSIRDMSITLAIQSAFFKKYNTDLNFAKTTAKFFQTANDRINYVYKRNKF